MRYITLTAVLVLSASLASNAAAGEIYKWTDEDGNVNYTDKPMGPSSEHLDITSRATDNAGVQAQTQARLDRQAAAAEEAAKAPAGPTRDELRAEASERAEKCNMYQERMTRFVQSRHLYREDENGERVYLDESEKSAAEQNVQDQITEYCNS